MKKIGIILIIIFSVVLVFFISMAIGANLSSKEINEKNQKNEAIEKNEEIKETEEELKPIKCEYIRIDVNADNETLKKHMKQYDDENTYLLSIRDIKTFENIENMLEIKYENNDDSRIDKDTFEKYNCDVLLIFVENKNKVGIQNVLSYKEKIVINFANDQIDVSVKGNQMFCILISKEDNKDNIEISYLENKVEDEQNKEKVNFKPFYIENIKEFDNIDLNYNENEQLYYTTFLDMNSYNELSDKLKINTQSNITREDIEGKDIAVIFKKTNKKIKMKKIKEEANSLNVELTETDEEYGKGITGMIVITEKGKYSTYTSYIK